jgi:hypothetical protein
MNTINKLLSRLDLMLVRPSRLNTAIKQQAAEHLQQVEDLQQRLVDLSHENEKPRCDAPWQSQIQALTTQLQKQKVMIQRLRVRVSYYKRRAVA